MTDEPMTSPEDLIKFRQGDEQTAIDAATRDVRDYCGWHVGPSRRETLRVLGKGGETVWLPSLHVTEIHELLVDGRGVALKDLHVSRNGRVLRRTGRFRANAVVEADVTHGHDPIPASVVEVVHARASRILDDPNGNIASLMKGPFQTQFTSPEDDTHRSKLHPYRIPRTR